MTFLLVVEYQTTLDHAFECPEGPDGEWEHWTEPQPPEPDAGWVIAKRLPIDFATKWRRVRLVEADHDAR